jgi:signal transduction histidine kinase/HAMP domain-containing protein/ActR/RegA family two-component response regulator
VARLTLARSLRLALLGLTVVLAAVAAGGVAYLYETRQTYEDRLADAYELRTAASRLLAAGVVEEATLRTARGSAAYRQRRSARRAFELTLADARKLAAGDPPSVAALETAARKQAALRARPRSDDAPLAARESLAVLARRQRARLEEARKETAKDSRTAVLAAGAGGLLALITALILVGAVIASVRRPLDRLVEAAQRLAAGDLSARVPDEGPAELRTLAAGFNAMAADLEGASARVEAERRRLDTTIRSLGDALVITDAAGIVEQTNPRAEVLVPDLEPGIELGERLGELSEALADEQTLERDGRTLLITAAKLGDDGGVVWTVRDGTERVRLERLKSEFVATASHELRSPLTSIKGFVELLAASSDPLTDRQREFIQIVELSTNRLVDLVNDLLDVARVEAGRVEIHRRPTDMSEAVREVAMLIRPRIDEKAQRLELELPADLPLALADPSRIRQILTNLVTNAHLYTESGGTLSVSLRSSGHHIVMEVADDGRGMNDEEIEHAFDRFYRGRGEGTHANQPGTGLGLAIVRALVELHGGSVTVTSAPGEGTRFTVRIPRAPDAAEGLPAPRHALRGRRVLVVDDEPEIAGLIAQRLAPYEVETVMVNSGEEALEHLRTGRFDAITLDILMPGISGFEVLRTLRADPMLRGIPVVVVSVFSGREALAGEWVVPKPIDADELVDALGQAILAGRVSVLVVARGELRDSLEPTLFDLGIEYEWCTDPLSAAQMCLDHFFEVALVDAGLHDPEAAMAALDLRGRRLRRSVVVFAGGDEPGLARFDAEPVAVEEAGATVLGLLQAEQT